MISMAKILRNLRLFLGIQKKPRAVIVLYMIQDLDFALILHDFLKTEGIYHTFIITRDLANKSPRVITALSARRAKFLVLPRITGKLFTIFLSAFDALFTIVESTAPAHRVGYEVTKSARSIGLHTYTFQHGLENIGLTYFDEQYTRINLLFASDTIFTWCHEDKLHKDILIETKTKCLRVGCPKSANLVTHETQIKEKANNRDIVSIFENLHWERYDDRYRDSFIQNVIMIAKEFPDILFIIKPHHAGQWLTRKYKGSLDFGPNVLVASPTDPLWEPHTGPDFIAASIATITTPSTIALDAALLEKPVAIAGEHMSFDFYKPLPILSDIEDWKNFVRKSIHLGVDEHTKTINNEFIASVTSPGDTKVLIVDKLLSDFQTKGVKYDSGTR